MPWRIEVWVRGLQGGGQWKLVSTTEDMGFAREGVKAIAAEHGLARALLDDPEEGGWCGMRAYRHKGFCCWTGSGGYHGG